MDMYDYADGLIPFETYVGTYLIDRTRFIDLRNNRYSTSCIDLAPLFLLQLGESMSVPRAFSRAFLCAAVVDWLR
jgi:hypothetical protein